MTDNAPINADDDGLDKAAQLLGIYLEEIGVDGYIPINVNRQTLAHILTDRKKHELQARIDELGAIYGWSHDDRSALIFYPGHISKDFAQMAENGMGTKHTVSERLRELKQELEKL